MPLLFHPASFVSPTGVFGVAARRFDEDVELLTHEDRLLARFDLVDRLESRGPAG
jgi:hypothetical protein